jgi:hypothetical protein
VLVELRNQREQPLVFLAQIQHSAWSQLPLLAVVMVALITLKHQQVVALAAVLDKTGQHLLVALEHPGKAMQVAAHQHPLVVVAVALVVLVQMDQDLLVVLAV